MKKPTVRTRMVTYTYMPLWKQWLVKLLGKRWGYDNECFGYEFCGKLYIFK